MQLLECIDRILKTKTKETCIMSCNNICMDKHLTYESVNKIQNKLYEEIRNMVKEHSCIALYMKHNVYLPSIIISLLRNKCSFMFMNLKRPNLNTLKNLRIKWLISCNTEELVKQMFKDVEKFKSVKLDKDDEVDIWKIQNDDICLKGICYVVETSGTTGTNKIIQVEEDCIASNIYALLEILNLSNEIIYFGTPLTFDPSMIELFLSLISGSCLLIVDAKLRSIPHLLLQAMFPTFHKGVTFLQMAPSVFNCWQSDDMKYIFEKSTLKYILLGGERFPNQVLNYYDNKKNLRLFNIYGITEVSCWASIYEITTKDCKVSIGSALKDTLIEVRDDQTQVFDGIGELFIGSALRKCYINDEGKGRDNVIFRATGDLVEIRNGLLYYVSRKDDIIKRFGHRINIKALEDIIEKATNLENHFIWLDEALHLVLFVRVKYTRPLDKSRITDKLRVKLLHLLPKESMPDHIEVIEKFPLTCNGKINKKALEEMYIDGLYLRRQLNAEPLLVFKYLLKKYFGMNNDDIEQLQCACFTEIGGNSIILMQLLNEYEDTLNCEYPKVLVQMLLEEKLSDVFKLIESVEFQPKVKIKEKDSMHNFRVTENLHIKWSYDLKSCVDCTALIIQDSYVVVGAFSQIFALLNVSDGSEFLQLTFSGPIEASATFSMQHQYIFIGCYDGNMYCISLCSKEIIWHYQTNDKIKCKPTICKSDTAIVFGSYDKYVYCVHIEDGSLIWKTKINESVTVTPIHFEELSGILICTTLGKCVMLEEYSGRTIWSIITSYPIFSTPCVFKNVEKTGGCARLVLLANVNGNLSCLDISKGEIMWKHEIGNEIFSSLINFQNCIVFGTNSNKLYCLQPFANGCKIKFSVSLDGPIISTPCTTNTHIIASTTSGSIFLIDSAGNIVGCKQLKGEIFSSPVIWNNYVFIGCRDNNVYCLEIEL